MNLNDMVLKTVKYKFENVIIYVGTSTQFQVDPSMVGDVYIEKDYENSVLPYFQMTINVPNWLAREMRKDSQNIRVGFAMKYGLYDDVTNNNNVVFTTEISGKFYGIIESSGSEAAEDKYIEIEKADKTYKSGYMYNEYALVDIMIVNETYYKNLNNIYNQVFSSATPVNALTYVLNQAGYNNILLSPPNNNTSYSQFKVIPIPLVKQIKRICYDYALHKNGSVIFFDLDKGYIVDKQPKCTAYVSNEYKTTYLTSLAVSSQSASQANGLFINKKEKYNLVNLVDGTFKFKNTANIENTSSIQVINTDTGQISSASTGTKGSPMVLTYTGGSNSSEQVAKSIAEQTTILTITSSDCILSALTPNKEFIFYTDNNNARPAKVNGNYRITKMVCSLIQDGEFWRPITSAEFRK